jgi:hypothetical protein
MRRTLQADRYRDHLRFEDFIGADAGVAVPDEHVNEALVRQSPPGGVSDGQRKAKSPLSINSTGSA